MTSRTCAVKAHTRRLPPPKWENATHIRLRAEVAEMRFAADFTKAFEAEMRKPWLVSAATKREALHCDMRGRADMARM